MGVACAWQGFFSVNTKVYGTEELLLLTSIDFDSIRYLFVRRVEKRLP
jgi:hypothetical protein